MAKTSSTGEEHPLNRKNSDDERKEDKDTEAGENGGGGAGDGAQVDPKDVGRVNGSEMCMNLMMFVSLFFMTIPFLMMVIFESPKGDEWTMYVAKIVSIISIVIQVFLFLLIIARYFKWMGRFRMWVTRNGQKKKRMVRLILLLNILIPILHGFIMALVAVHMMGMDMVPFFNSTNQTGDAVTMETTTATTQL